MHNKSAKGERAKIVSVAVVYILKAGRLCSRNHKHGGLDLILFLFKRGMENVKSYAIVHRLAVTIYAIFDSCDLGRAVKVGRAVAVSNEGNEDGQAFLLAIFLKGDGEFF